MQNVELFIEDIREKMQSTSADQLEKALTLINQHFVDFDTSGEVGRLELTQCFAVFIIGVNIRNKLLRLSQKITPHIETLSNRFGSIMLDAAKAAMTKGQNDIDDIYSILYKIQAQLRSREIKNKNGIFKNNLYETSSYVYNNRLLLETIGLLGSKSSGMSYIEVPEYKQFEAFLVSFFSIFESNDLFKIGNVLKILLKIKNREMTEVQELVKEFDNSINISNKYFNSKMFHKRANEFKQRFISKINIQVNKHLKNFHDRSLNKKNEILESLARLQTLETFLPEGDTLSFIGRKTIKLRAKEIEPVEAMIQQVISRLSEERSSIYSRHWDQYISYYSTHNHGQEGFEDFFSIKTICQLDRPNVIAVLEEKRNVVTHTVNEKDYKASFVRCEEIILDLLSDLKSVFADVR